MRTPEESWLAALASVPVWQPPLKPTLLISPHPDDETLGAGGLLAGQRRRGVDVHVVAVTDGEAAYADAFNLALIRRAEQQAALKELGVGSAEISRLGLPDSAVSSHEEELKAALAPLVSRDTLLLAPWICDPHPDHEACGRAARRVAENTGCELISYFFWAWHRFGTPIFAGLSLRKLELDEPLQKARAAALAHHRSQLYREDGSPVLPESLLAPARRPFETFLVDEN